MNNQLGCPIFEGSTPHPVPLPMGEGTLHNRSEHRPLSHGERDRVRGDSLSIISNLMISATLFRRIGHDPAPQPSPMPDPREGRLRRIKALARKETLQTLRDPSSLIVAVVLPMILLFLYGYGVSFDVTTCASGS